MELKQGYKQTEVGVIPEDWELVSLADISAFITKGSTPTTYGFKWERSGVLFLRSECVSENGLDLTQSMFISPKAHLALRRSEVCDGDILVTITGNVGRVVWLMGVGNANLNQHIARVRITDVNADSRYIYHYLSQPLIRRRLNLITTGQAYPQLSLQQIRDAKVAFPPAKDQHAIATALSDMDALLATQDKLITKKRDIKQAAMQQLLTGKKRLPGFTGEWKVKRLGDICGHITTGKLDANAMVVSGEYPFFTCAREHYFIDEYAFDADALLVSGNGANVGYVHHYTGKFNAYQRTYVLTDFNAEIVYLRLFMDRNLQERLRTEVNAGNTPYITMDTLTDMSVALPSSREEQAAIATVLSDMDADLTALEQQRDKTLALKQGMMQELLTGRIRLV